MLAIRIVAGSTGPFDLRNIIPRLRGASVRIESETKGAGFAGNDCDAVAFLEPQQADRPLFDKLLTSGRHVLLAGSPGLPREDLESLANVAQGAGVQFATWNPDRYLPSRQLIRQQVGGKLGVAALVRLHRWESASGEAAIPASLNLPSALFRDLDLALWLTDLAPDHVFAVAHPEDGTGAPAGRFLQVHLGFPQGMALIDYCSRMPAGPGYQSLSVIGASGAAYADDHQNMQLLYQPGGPKAVRGSEAVRQYTALVQDFIDAVAAGRDLSGSVAAWRNVYAVAGAVRASLTT